MLSAPAFAGISKMRNTYLHIKLPISLFSTAARRLSISIETFENTSCQTGLEKPCHAPNKKILLKEGRNLGSKFTHCSQIGQTKNLREQKLRTPSEFRIDCTSLAVNEYCGIAKKQCWTQESLIYFEFCRTNRAICSMASMQRNFASSYSKTTFAGKATIGLISKTLFFHPLPTQYFITVPGNRCKKPGGGTDGWLKKWGVCLKKWGGGCLT